MHFASLAHHIDSLAHLSYPGIFLAVLASGHIVPVPESVTLLLLGYLASLGKLHILGVILTGILATTVFDLFMYAISFGGSELATKLSKRIKTSLIQRYERAEERHLFFLVFVSHFVPGWRFANPIIVGLTRVPWKKFLLYSLISNAVYASLYVGFGFVVSGRITRVIVALQSVSHLFLIVFVIAVGISLVVYNIHRHAKK